MGVKLFKRLHMNAEANFFDLSKLGNLFILEEKKLISSEELVSGIVQLKNKLQKYGVGPGHKVVLCLNNSRLFCEYLFASWELGACVIPATPFSTPTEIKQLLSSLTPSLIVYADGKSEFFYESTLTSKETMLILQTSGSSGKPKGVILPRKAIQAKIEIYSKYLPLKDFRNTLCMLPLNFGHGLITNFLFPILSGHSVFLAPAGQMDVYSNLGQIIDEHDISCFSSVPSILKIASNFSEPPIKRTLKKIFCASAHLDKATWEKALEWSQGVRVNNMYGMTELASWIGGDQKEGREYQENTFDSPWGAEIKIAKENEDDDYGEIHVKSESMMTGYFDDDANTKKVLVNGWFKTGDIGILQEGRVILKGRLDNVINLGGVKIYPEEINQLIKLHPKVADCYTLGLRKREIDSDHGIGCIIVSKTGETVDILEIQEMCKKHLSSFKIPTQFKSIEKLPVTERGKVDRQAIKNIFQVGQGK